MKKTLITLILLVGFLNLTAQNAAVAWYNWSNPTSYQLSPSPYIIGYGYDSDSLSKAFGGITFYEFNGDYYPINTWADYYFWYVKKYWYQFSDPQLYKYYYLIKDEFGMASYIAGNNYQGRYYPSRINIIFSGKEVDINRLCANSRYIASNDKKVKKLKRKILSDEKFYQKKRLELAKEHRLDNKKDLVKKPVYVNKTNKQNNTVKKDYSKPIKKEVKFNKYEHKAVKSLVRYGNTNTNSRNSSTSSSNTQRKSSGSKTIK